MAKTDSHLLLKKRASQLDVKFMRSKSDLEVCATKGMGRNGKWNEESPLGVVSGEGKDLGLVLGPLPHKLSRQFVGV